jgi:hypothetical protein
VADRGVGKARRGAAVVRCRRESRHARRGERERERERAVARSWMVIELGGSVF